MSELKDRQAQRTTRVARDPAAKFVRDLATATPPKELSMLKAAADAAERELRGNPSRGAKKRASR